MTDWTTIVSDLETGLAFVQKISPAASMGGPVAAAIGAVVGNVAGLANAYLQQASAAEAVIQSSDLAQIEALTAQLQASNDALAAQIAGS